jgi:hypothetical protein
VYFKKGFTVPAGATINLNINTNIDGPINLNGTGKIVTAKGLFLGLGAEGFPSGGILKSTDFVGSGNILMTLFNDISIGGQLTVLDTPQAFFYLQGNSITFLDEGASRGSIVIKDTTGYTGGGYGNIQFYQGTVFGLEDHKDGSGPRIRVAALFEPAVWMLDTTFVLAPESTMTCTSYRLDMPIYLNHIKTPSRATVNALSGLQIYSEGSLFLGPGITLRETDSAAWSYGLAWADTGTFLGIDNATLEMNNLHAGGSGTLVVKGRSCLRGLGVNAVASLGTTNIDIAGGASLVCDNIAISKS